MWEAAPGDSGTLWSDEYPKEFLRFSSLGKLDNSLDLLSPCSGKVGERAGQAALNELQILKLMVTFIGLDNAVSVLGRS